MSWEVGRTSINEAHEALRLAEADPARATALATEAARRARTDRDHATTSVAERALGVAALHLRDPETAIRHLRTAVVLGRRASSPELEADARIRLAFTLNVRGRARQALQEIDDVLRLDVDGLRRARAAAQRGVIDDPRGPLAEAVAHHRAALPGLRRAGDRLWLQRVLSNRGVLRGYRHEFGAAETDLHEAENLCRSAGLELSLGFVHQNLGWVAGVRGDVPLALDYLHRAEQCFRRLGSELGELLTDRSQLLLSAFLVAEARESAEQAVQVFERSGRQIMLPEVRLLLAQTAMLSGRHDQALDQARRSVREFIRQQRPAWATLARFIVWRLRLGAGEAPRGAVGRLVQLADALTEAGWSTAAVESRVLAGRLAVEQGRIDKGRSQLALAASARHRGHATLRARAWYAEALLREAGGNRRGARIALRCGLRILDEHRATFAATDLRAFASGHRIELAEFGLTLALADGRAARVLRWAEEGRASHLALRPVRPPDDPDLAQSVAELRATVSEIATLGGAGPPPTRLEQRRIELEHAIRDQGRRVRAGPSMPSHPSVAVPQLAAALGASALVEFVGIGPDMHAVTVVEGRATLHALGRFTQVTELIDAIPFALRRLGRASAHPASHRAAAALLRHTAERLDAIILRPLAASIGDRALVVVPTGPLQSLPWSVLPSCRGRPVTVAPSASLWHTASRPSAGSSRVVVAAGPGLDGARDEADAVAAHHGVTPLIDASATVEAVMAALDGAHLAHVAAHGQVHPHNPLFSAIHLADGPLTVYDLERLDDAPQMVVLSACNSGSAVVTAGDELLGLAATFLAQGTRLVVASVMPVPDVETTQLMIAFHQLLGAGRSAVAALAEAQTRLDVDDHAAVAAAAGFVCLGADWSQFPGPVAPVRHEEPVRRGGDRLPTPAPNGQDPTGRMSKSVPFAGRATMLASAARADTPSR